jgi:hypothetical protein
MGDIDQANAIKAILDVVEKLNGVDHYVPAEVPDAPLTGAKVMVFTKTLFEKVVAVPEAQMGKAKALDQTEVFILACVNYEYLHAATHPMAAEVAVLRALIASRGVLVKPLPEAAKIGMEVYAAHTKRPEILIVASPGEIGFDKDHKITRIGAVFQPVVNAIRAADNEDYIKMATLLPMFAAIEFQKTNHHYIDDDFYKESYKRHFKSAQLLALEPKWNKASIIYDAVHWMGPYNMEVYKNNLCSDARGYVPRGIVVKSNPAPAGTALCRTQIAIWKAIGVYPGGQELINIYAGHLKAMTSLAEDINKDRLAYHVYAPLFNKASLLDAPQTVERMSSCASLAAIAQAFIETIAKGTDLARARALKKHADQNIALFKIASAVFKGTLRKVEREATVHALISVIKGDRQPITAQIEAAPIVEEPPNV